MAYSDPSMLVFDHLTTDLINDSILAEPRRPRPTPLATIDRRYLLTPSPSTAPTLYHDAKTSIKQESVNA